MGNYLTKLRIPFNIYSISRYHIHAYVFIFKEYFFVLFKCVVCWSLNFFIEYSNQCVIWCDQIDGAI